MSKSTPVRVCVLTSIDYFFLGMNLASLIFSKNNQKVRQKSYRAEDIELTDICSLHLLLHIEKLIGLFRSSFGKRDK